MCDKRTLEEASFGRAWGVEYQHIGGLDMFMLGFGLGVYGRASQEGIQTRYHECRTILFHDDSYDNVLGELQTPDFRL